MPDALTSDLTAALEAEGQQLKPDLEWVLRRGARIRMARAVAVVVTSLALIGAGLASANLLGSNGDRAIPIPAASDHPPDRSDARPVVEEMTAEQHAEVFAFRALAATGVMDPLGERTYTWTYDDDTTNAGGKWQVGFAAADCAPRTTEEGMSQTCRPFGGEDPQTGNPFGADAFVEVEREGSVWRVTAVHGNMPDDQRNQVVGFELEQRDEPSHWELPAVSLWRMTDETSVQMLPIWVGPLPTRAPGSVCRLQPVDGDGRPSASPRVFYLEPPHDESDRAGWVRGTGVEPNEDIEDARVTCRQYTGAGWEVSSTPEIVGEPGAALGATAEIVWRGHEAFTAPAACRASLVDENGTTVWEGATRILELWRPSELRDYPYRREAVVTTRGELVEAYSVGEFVCDTI